MAATTFTTANDILNRVAAEVGVEPVADPFASVDPIFVKLRYLLNIAGEELTYAHPWEYLTETHQITTQEADSGIYDLPDDFLYMINQTGWERSQNIPLGGPLSAQDWTYLIGRDLQSTTLYASFRIADGKFNIYPAPPPSNLDINFEYISKNWASDGAVTPTYKDAIASGSDVPRYDKTLISRYLKVKHLDAGGFDSMKAQTDFNQVFSFITGFDKAAGILNTGRSYRHFPFLSVLNLPDTNYGLT